jgi:hypothetical protein
VPAERRPAPVPKVLVTSLQHAVVSRQLQIRPKEGVKKGSYTADDIRALSRGGEVRGSNRRSLSSSSLLNLFEPSLSVHIEFAAEGHQALGFVVSTPADTTDLYNFLRQLCLRAVHGELRPPPSDSPQQALRRTSESAPPATLEAMLGSPSVCNSTRAAFARAPRTPTLVEEVT